MPGIATAVPAFALSMEAVQPLDRLHHPGPLQLADEAVALRIDVRRDVMGDLSRRVAEAHLRVECGGAESTMPPFI